MRIVRYFGVILVAGLLWAVLSAVLRSMGLEDRTVSIIGFILLFLASPILSGFLFKSGDGAVPGAVDRGGYPGEFRLLAKKTAAGGAVFWIKEASDADNADFIVKLLVSEAANLPDQLRQRFLQGNVAPARQLIKCPDGGYELHLDFGVAHAVPPVDESVARAQRINGMALPVAIIALVFVFPLVQVFFGLMSIGVSAWALRTAELAGASPARAKKALYISIAALVLGVVILTLLVTFGETGPAGAA